MKCRPAHWRRARLLQPRQDPPAVQLQHTTTHQCMRGDGVRAITPTIDGKNPHPLPCHQHGSGGTRTARTDDKRVIGLVSEHVSRLR